MSQSTGGGQAESRGSGAVMLGAGVAIFVVCVIIQAACGSSMFSTSYADPGSTVKDLLINVTFWPGWMLSLAFALKGVMGMVQNK